MIFAYIYTLVSWGQISEKQGENVKETRAYHLYICLTPPAPASGQFECDPKGPISSVFNFQHLRLIYIFMVLSGSNLILRSTKAVGGVE